MQKQRSTNVNLMDHPVPFMQVDNVFCTFAVKLGLFSRKRPLHAVNGVSFSIYKGEIMGLVGESGCGKTTLAKMLIGLLRPADGEILIEGMPISGKDRRALSRKIQYISQDPYSSLNPRKKVGSIISLPLRVNKVGNPSSWQNKIEEMIDLVGLPRSVCDCYPMQLSGGQRQRVAIARALILRPELVICDEPTSALDVSVQSQILNLLIDLQKSLGLTYLFITHNLALVQHIATRVAVMYLGRIVEKTRTNMLFGNPRHPYTEVLLKSVLTMQPGLRVTEVKLDGSFPNPIDPPSGCSFHPRCPRAMPVCWERAPLPHKDTKGYLECLLHDHMM